ncbi:MAG: MBL fold metallo-hydrolase [Rubrivivax sp.]
MTASPAQSLPAGLPAGIVVLERGWLSSNNVLLRGSPDDDGDVLVDAGHVSHAPQTLALVRQALDGHRLAAVVNTHLHSDHCGGNAALQRTFGCRLGIPPGQWLAVQRWDEVALTYAPTAQRCERFSPDFRLVPGQALTVGGFDWQVLAAPGHDPHSVILFEPSQRVAITADALWQRGFGIVFQELDGERAFDDVADVLDLIESLDARWAIPGHGAPFNEVPAALVVARQRLAAFRADPDRHARHAMKALVKFHLLAEQQQTWPQLQAWLERGALYGAVWQRLGRPAGSLAAFAQHLVKEMAASGALALRDGVVFNH